MGGLVRALVFVLGSLAHAHVVAANCVSQANGNWDAPGTWTGCAGGNGTVAGTPGNADTVTILGADNVTVNIPNAAAISVQVGGTTGGSGNGALTFVAGSQLTVSGTLTFGNGARTGTITMTAGGTLSVGNVVAPNVGTWTPGAGTVVLTADNTLPNNTEFDTFNDLRIAGGTTTLSRGTAVGGSLTVDVGATWNGAGQAVTLTGNLTNNGTFTSGAGTYTFNGAGAQNLDGTAAGTTTIQSLTLSNGGNLVLSGNHSLTVSTLLTLTNGTVTTNANVLTISNGSAIASAGGNDFVIGNLRKAVAAGGSVARTFETGTGATYCPVTVTFTAVSVAGEVTVSCNAGSHPQLAGSGLDTTTPAKLNRWWGIANGPAAVTATSYAATFTYIAGDIDPGANAAAFQAVRYDGVAWSPATLAGTPTTTQLSITGETGFGAFAMGEPVGYNAIPGSGGRFNAYDPPPLTPAGAVNGSIRTKLAGTAFTLTLVHLNPGGTALQNLNSAVLVDLMDATNNSGAFANNCGPNWTVIQTVNGNFAGNTISVNFTEASAWREVRVRVRTNPAAQAGCSGDRFSIRPAAFTLGSSANNNGTGAGTTVRAGANFTITAAHTGYAGTPGVDTTQVVNAPNQGTLTGSFAAAVGGTATGTFTYSEVGTIGLNADAVTDAAFTAVDQPADCVAGSTSNALSGGRYGCVTGSVAVARNPGTSGFGRFTPDHYTVPAAGTVTHRSALTCAPASTFTYLGERFSVAFPLEARNAAGGVTGNYAGPYVKLTTATVGNQLGFGGRGGTTDLTPRVVLISSAGAFANGSAPVTASMSVSRGAAPEGPYAPASIGIAPSDSDGVTALSTEMNLDVDGVGGNDHVLVGSPPLRFGRARLLNAVGSERLPLPIPLRVEHWSGTAFVTNGDDSCTSFTRANFALGPYTGNLAACETIVNPATVTMSSGVGTMNLTAPGAGNDGTVVLTLNLGAAAIGSQCAAVGGAGPADTPAGMSYLQGAFTTPAYTENPASRAAFGLYGGQPRNYIYFRENF